MNKPIIGIVAKPGYKDEHDIWNRMDIVDELRLLVVKSGGIALVILPTENTMTFNDNDILDKVELNEQEIKDLHQVVNMCDGIILQGGLVSCNYEIEVAKKAIELDIPLIGICAGFNNILRAIGTDVIYDETKSHNYYDMNYRHNINVIKDTQLWDIYGQDKMQVNSIHTMIAPKELVEPFTRISSISDEGLVESFELKDKKFALGIKWHPELMLDEEFTNKLFKRFIEECKSNI